MTKRLWILVAAVWLIGPGPVGAQTGENVLLVTNALSQASEEIGVYYAGKRAVPNRNLLRLSVPVAEEISRGDYESKIERPIAEWMAANSAQDRILYIVLTKDVPLRILGTSGQAGTVASVDSELTLQYRKFYVPVGSPGGSTRNPFFSEKSPTPTTERFSHKSYDIYLVARLDGFTVADVKGLIDRGVAPGRDGTIVLDGKVELTQTVGGRWLTTAANTLKALPEWSERIVFDSSLKTITDQSQVMGFYTWGSNANGATDRHYRLQFSPGAIGAEYVSTDARTFKEPPPDWAINDTRKPFNGSHQSLIGDLIRDGITGVAGHVAEPFLNGTVRPDVLFPAYLSGFNLIESFYMAIPFVSWQTVVIGDPLCVPFGARTLDASEVAPPIDPETELPQYLSTRRLQTMTGAGTRPDLAKWMIRAEVARARKDRASELNALEQATTIDAEFAPANLALGVLYEMDRNWDAAIERYKRTIDKSPNNVTALNNLAWLLATQKRNPQEAFAFATKAYVISVQAPEVGDTLAWTYHLMNNDAAAESIALSAARLLPTNTDVQIRAATIVAGVNRHAQAKQLLDAALRLDPSLATREDVVALQARLSSAKP